MTVIHLMGVIGPPIGAALVTWIPIQAVMVTGTAIALIGALVFAYSAFQTGIRARLQASQEAVAKLATLPHRARRAGSRGPEQLPTQGSEDRE
jgi:hypothetical protein